MMKPKESINLSYRAADKADRADKMKQIRYAVPSCSVVYFFRTFFELSFWLQHKLILHTIRTSLIQFNLLQSDELLNTESNFAAKVKFYDHFERVCIAPLPTKLDEHLCTKLTQKACKTSWYLKKYSDLK